MAPGKIKKAIGALKDSTTISLARIGSCKSIAKLEIAIVKATRHCETPPNQRYISEILRMINFSHNLNNDCVGIITVRLKKTKNWVVALKVLVLIQCLLSEDCKAFENEMIIVMRKGTKFLTMREFRDASSKRNAWDYTAFVRTYALFIDEQLEFRMQDYRGRSADCWLHRDEISEGSYDGTPVAVKPNPVPEMKTEEVFSRMNLLMQLLGRFLACRPAGAAKHNRVAAVSLCPILRESFKVFHNIEEILGILIERFMQLDIPDMVKVYEIFCEVSKQYDELDSFYNWCKGLGIMRFSEFPDVKRIPQAKLDMMDDLICQKAAMLRKRTNGSSTEPKIGLVEQVRKAEPKKALPQPEKSTEQRKDEVKEKKEEKPKIQEEKNLLDLYDDTQDTEDYGDRLALALFDGYQPTTSPASTATPWDAFNESSGDWETALIQSASHLSNQKPSLPRGFDAFTLENMYQRPAVAQVGTGSASSVAGRQNVLALPAPAAAHGGSADPFAASLAVMPPSYVQMSEIERKHSLLLEEQMMWQLYARDGMQGQVGMPNVQYQNSYQYIQGGYTQTW